MFQFFSLFLKVAREGACLRSSSSSFQSLGPRKDIAFCLFLVFRSGSERSVSKQSLSECALKFLLINDLFLTVIKEEAIDSRAEVKVFDQTKLKHVETEEKNPLPTPQTLKEELRPESLPDVSGVKGFDAGKLKHVETQDKTVLPTKEGEL